VDWLLAGSEWNLSCILILYPVVFYCKIISRCTVNKIFKKCFMYTDIISNLKRLSDGSIYLGFGRAYHISHTEYTN